MNHKVLATAPIVAVFVALILFGSAGYPAIHIGSKGEAIAFGSANATPGLANSNNKAVSLASGQLVTIPVGQTQWHLLLTPLMITYM